MFFRTFVVALLLGTAAIPPPASAQTLRPVACGQRDAITAKLEQRYSEHQKGAGLVSGTRLLEIWHSEKTGTWTILMTRPDGIACVMATGKHWRDTPPLTVSGNPV